MAHNFMMAVSEAGTTHRVYRSNPETMARTLEESVERYDLDGVLLDVDTALLASACGADVVYPDDAPAVVKGVQLPAIGNNGCEIVVRARIPNNGESYGAVELLQR